jgi:hypothetical protein
MANGTKGSRPIHTMSALVDRRRTRTAAGALLELSSMASEKQLLTREIERWARRNVQVQARLAEIADKERRLMRVVDGSMPAAADVAVAQANAAAASGGSRIKIKEFSY